MSFSSSRTAATAAASGTRTIRSMSAAMKLVSTRWRPTPSMREVVLAEGHGRHRSPRRPAGSAGPSGRPAR